MKVGRATSNDIAMLDLWIVCEQDWDRAIAAAAELGYPRDSIYMALLRIKNMACPGDLERGVFPMPLSDSDIAAMSADPVTHDHMLELMRARGVPEELVVIYDQANLQSVLESEICAVVEEALAPALQALREARDLVRSIGERI